MRTLLRRFLPRPLDRRLTLIYLGERSGRAASLAILGHEQEHGKATCLPVILTHHDRQRQKCPTTCGSHVVNRSVGGARVNTASV